MKNTNLVSAIWFASIFVLSLSALAKPYTPKPGSSERTAIMNATRKVLGSGKHKAIITANHLKVENGWAYLTGSFKYADSATLEPRFREGSGTHFSALLHREKGKWVVKRRVYNGDVIEPVFIHDFPNAPKGIFH
jgi:hypothetical protein